MQMKIKITTAKERSACLQGTDKNYTANMYYEDKEGHLISMEITGFGITRGGAIKNAKYKLNMLLGAICEFGEKG